MTTCIVALNWVKQQWSNSDLGDKRRNKRLIKLANNMINKSDQSITKQNQVWSDIKGAYRLLSSDHVTHQKLQKDHWENTQQAAHEVDEGTGVLHIQDKSELDYSSLRKTEGLGFIGNHKGRGISIQSILSVTYNRVTPRVLGLDYQKAWVRSKKSRKAEEKRSQLYKRSKESDYWIECLDKIERGNTPQKHVTVGDRENDTYAFLKYCKRTKWHYVVRSPGSRSILTNENKRIILKKFARSLPSQGTIEIELRTRNNEPARKILLHLAWEKIRVIPPRNGTLKKDYDEIDAWCIRVWEDVPDGLEWILLTDMPIEKFDDALEKIEWYKLRWLIEEYHKCLKSGCSIEKSQLKNVKRLLNLLGILGVLAVKILELKYLVRDEPDKLAKEHIPTLPLKLLCAKFELSPDTITSQQFWHKIASLGGFVGRKSDGEPGWQTLWSGWMCFLDMLTGAEAMMNLSP